MSQYTEIKVSPEERVLMDKIESGDIKARNRLVMKYYPLVVKLTRPYKYKGFNREDLIQEGVIGLIRAIKSFDYNKGFKFSTYACYWIKQAIQMYVLKNSNIVKLPVRKSLQVARIKKNLKNEPGFSELNQQNLIEDEICPFIFPKLYQLALGTLSLEYLNEQGTAFKDFLTENNGDSVYNKLYNLDLKESIKNLLETLNENEREVLALRFGLHDGICTSLRIIGEMFEMSPESVRKIEKRALNKLRFSRDKLKTNLS